MSPPEITGRTGPGTAPRWKGNRALAPAVAVCRQAWRRLPAHWVYVLGLYLGVKVLFTLVGLVTTLAYHWVLTDLLPTRETDLVPSNEIIAFEAVKQSISPFRAVSMWFAWDSFIYHRIAGADWTGPQQEFAFPLLYPFLARALSVVLGGDVALGLVLISNIAFVGALHYAHRLGGLLLPEEADARRFTRYIVLLPTAFLFQAALTESLFLCLMLACFYYGEQRRWLLVGIIGFFLALSRSVGFLLALPLALMLLEQHRYRLDREAIIRYLRSGWPLLLVPGGWFAFMAYCRWQAGDWFAYQRAQKAGWGITTHNPLETVWNGLTGHATDAARMWFAVAALAVIAVGAVNGLRPPYVVCALLLILVPLSIGAPVYRSLLRYLVVVFPLALLFARWARRRSVDTFLSSALALVQGALFALWLTYWAHFII